MKFCAWLGFLIISPSLVELEKQTRERPPIGFLIQILFFHEAAVVLFLSETPLFDKLFQ